MLHQQTLTDTDAAPLKLQRSLRDIENLIDSIDLVMVKKKLMEPDEGQGWSSAYVDFVETRYRCYLTMIAVQPDGQHVPCRDIDLFWHQHILDTRAYASDCERVFGEFIHHFPYLGMRGPDDAENLNSAFEKTKLFYAELFGEDYASGFDEGDLQDDTRVRSGKCSSSCGSSKCSHPYPGKCGSGYCYHPWVNASSAEQTRNSQIPFDLATEDS